MVLTCSILPIIVMAIGTAGPARPAQVSTRTASSTTEVILTSTPTAATTYPGKTATPTTRYVVQPGDTLSAIAARFAIHGGWPALYTANRHAIGPDPDTIHPGTVLVLPGQAEPPPGTPSPPAHTLIGIAAALAVPGGWAALYTANRHAIGPDPDVIHPGTILTLPRPASPRPSQLGDPLPQPDHPARPATTAIPPGGHPAARPPPSNHTSPPPPPACRTWLKTMLLAAGLLVLAAMIAEPVLAARRRPHSIPTRPRPSPSGTQPAAARTSSRLPSAEHTSTSSSLTTTGSSSHAANTTTPSLRVSASRRRPKGDPAGCVPRTARRPV